MRYSLTYVHKHHEALMVVVGRGILIILPATLSSQVLVEVPGLTRLWAMRRLHQIVTIRMVPILYIECNSKTQTIHITSCLKALWLLLKALEWNRWAKGAKIHVRINNGVVRLSFNVIDKPFTHVACKALCHISYTNDLWHATKINRDCFISWEEAHVKI